MPPALIVPQDDNQSRDSGADLVSCIQLEPRSHRWANPGIEGTYQTPEPAHSTVSCPLLKQEIRIPNLCAGCTH